MAIPYRNTSVSMVVIMLEDLREFVDELSYEGVSEILEG